MFLLIQTSKNTQSMCQKILLQDILSLIVEQGKNHYAFFKDFSTLMCNYTLHRGRKHFCYYCLQTFSTKEILKCHINDCFKINVNVDVK